IIFAFGHRRHAAHRWQPFSGAATGTRQSPSARSGRKGLGNQDKLVGDQPLTPERAEEITKTMDRADVPPGFPPTDAGFTPGVAAGYRRGERRRHRGSGGGSLQAAAPHNGQCDVTADGSGTRQTPTPPTAPP